MERPPPRILVIRGGAIGDFILTLPALRLLRQGLPACRVEVLGYPGIVELAVQAGLADSTRSLEHRSMALLFARGARLDPALADYLRGFNLVVSYLYDPDGILRANLEAVGVKTLIECPHAVQPGQGPAARQLARPLERLALFLDEPDWRLPVLAPASRPWSLPAGARLALHPGSGSTRKNWPLERWLELARRIAGQRPDLRLTWVTGEAEEARGMLADLAGAVPGQEHWHALPLTELAERLAACGGFLGHDSGTAHLAAACGTPALLLFGPTDPQVWAPAAPDVRVLRAESGDLADLPVTAVWQAWQALSGV